MQHISKLPDLGTTIFTIMSKMAREHGALNLAQGFPGFQGDSVLLELVAKAMQEGHNQYAPMQGVFSLRKEVTNKVNTLYGSDYDPETEITITVGATQAIYGLVSTFVRPNDEVIILKPAYDCYEPAVVAHGGKVISIQLKAPDYKVHWEEVAAAISPQTKMLFINTPHNPTGTILRAGDIKRLAQILEGTNIILLSDEVYEHMIYDDELHQSIARYPDLKKRSFITASFGKTFHNTGWKIGYTLGPKELMEEFQKVHQFNVFSVHHPSQKAFASYLKTPEHYLELNDFFEQKRNLFLSYLEGSKFKAIPSAGTYFQMLDFSKITTESDIDFAGRLTKDHKLASIPTSVFNLQKEDHRMLRFCFAKDDEMLKRAAHILTQI